MLCHKGPNSNLVHHTDLWVNIGMAGVKDLTHRHIPNEIYPHLHSSTPEHEALIVWNYWKVFLCALSA